MQNLLNAKEKLIQLVDCSLDDVVNLVEIHAKHYHDGHFTVMSFTTGVKAMFGTVDLDTGYGREAVNNLPAYSDTHIALCYLLANDENYVVGA
jgi:hypothetical protein